MKKNVLPFILLLSILCKSQGQSTFQNLNFESAFGLPNSTSPVLVAVTNALPGWTVYDAGGSPDAQIFYNGVSAGTALVTLVGTNPANANPALAGNYSATLDAGETSTGLGPAAIAQTGTIPGYAQSIIFIGNYQINALTVSFEGQTLPIYQLETSANYQTYGVNISAYAGQTGELRFTENSIPGNNTDEFAIAYLDDIQFSNQQIPEPGSWALMMCGAAALMVRRRQATRKRNR